MDPEVITIESGCDGENPVPKANGKKSSGEISKEISAYANFVKAFSLLQSPQRKEFQPHDFKTPERLHFFQNESRSLTNPNPGLPVFEDKQKGAEELKRKLPHEVKVVGESKKRKSVKVLNTTVETLYPCKTCNPTTYFPTEKLLKGHIRRRHGTSLQCIEIGCSKIFGLKEQLRDHYNLEHTKNGQMPEPYFCDEKKCGKAFAKRSILSQHKVKEHPKFICQTCKEAFRTKAVLDNHLVYKNCGEGPQMIAAKKKAVAAAASALGTSKESEILTWFETQHEIQLERVGALSKHKTHKKTGKVISGSCDGYNPEENYCVEVKVITTANKFTLAISRDKSTPLTNAAIQELLKAMFVYNAPVGFMVYFYTIENKYYQFKTQWAQYEKYFDQMCC